MVNYNQPIVVVVIFMAVKIQMMYCINQNDILRKGCERPQLYSLTDTKNRRKLQQQNGKQCLIFSSQSLSDDSENPILEGITKPTTRKLAKLNSISSKNSIPTIDRVRSVSAQRRRRSKMKQVELIFIVRFFTIVL
jgi:hypothetical protein